MHQKVSCSPLALVALVSGLICTVSDGLGAVSAGAEGAVAELLVTLFVVELLPDDLLASFLLPCKT